jgi:hypothetical protein
MGRHTMALSTTASALLRLLQWVLLARPPHSGEPSYNASLEQVEAFLTTLATVYDDNGDGDHAALKAAESAALALA